MEKRPAYLEAWQTSPNPLSGPASLSPAPPPQAHAASTTTLRTFLSWWGYGLPPRRSISRKTGTTCPRECGPTHPASRPRWPPSTGNSRSIFPQGNLVSPSVERVRSAFASYLGPEGASTSALSGSAKRPRKPQTRPQDIRILSFVAQKIGPNKLEQARTGLESSRTAAQVRGVCGNSENCC